mmetsp:Transcript_110207/g.310837  ORF Transcript_110207/g.310837 Transcript_110207/m.310837 type:complete len:427 (-) Transcript_110207:140-1420(-)|eukprot:CAMPEP_0117561928 /NCGR_PEP_ID=MMETSP0784-20121206/54680_1 /TAXON_ID=39447 /ORGANISM="" /LENGTH=426 /DNA_ID=CAMNT_0005359455 /DNA_START=52 /DNA_END=1332 /DNA_ORIENTATION=-
MSSKFAKQYQVPPEFPEILKDFAREVLRCQPVNINEFAAKYFECLASGLPAGAQGQGLSETDATGAGADPEMSLESVEAVILELFRKYDQDGNCYLDPGEFKMLMEDLQKRLEFPRDEILRFLAEADQNQNGQIEYEEFIPHALQIIQSMYAKKRLEQHMVELDQQADELLVHGMSREELTGLLEQIFRRFDVDGTGWLNKQQFFSALTSMELGLTRREINAIMFEIDVDEDGNISYGEFVAFDLLQRLTRMRLLEAELESDELGQYLLDIFKAKDANLRGALSVEDIRDVLHQAMLGLTQMQIYTIISEADMTPDDHIVYSSFIPRAVGLIRSMFSFEKCIARETEDLNADVERQFFDAMDEAFPSGSVVSTANYIDGLASSGLLNEREIQATKHLMSASGDEVFVDQAKNETWSLVKSMRRSKQ